MSLKSTKKPELLSPAGSIEAVKAAIANGCNAIYLGGKQFNARAYAANFDNRQLEEVCDYAHLRNVKIYVTVNTLYKDSEFEELLEFVNELSMMGVDGLIMQDIGAISLVRKYFPSLPVHASTQLTANSLDDVLFYQKLGIKTVVMSRELSIEEIRRCVGESSINIEVFIHGALCVGYSGQCLFSSLLGERSGNRGKCAQGCRMNYQLCHGNDKIAEGYLISTKDICTLENLPALIEAGVASFKIEGRMKSPQYVALVTSIYRYYIDKYYEDPEHYQVKREDVERLLQIFNREGFSSGYLKTHSGYDMMSRNSAKDTGLRIGVVERYDPARNRVVIRLEKPLHKADGIAIGTRGCGINQDYNANQTISLPFEGGCRKGDIVYRTFDKQLNDEISSHLEGQFYYRSLDAKVNLEAGKAAFLKLSDEQGNTVEVSGETVQQAQKQPLSEEKIAEQIRRSGNTVYKINNVDIQTSGNIFMPVSQLNQLRSSALEQFDRLIISQAKRKPGSWQLAFREGKRAPKRLSALVTTSGQLEAVMAEETVDRIYLSMNNELMYDLKDTIEKAHARSKQLFVALPRVLRDYVMDNITNWLKLTEESETDGYLIPGEGAWWLLKDSRKKKVIDFSANCFNTVSEQFWKDLGADEVTMSLEMTAAQISEAAGENDEQIIYGYLPMMITHQCPIGNWDGNKNNHIYCEKRNNSKGYVLVNQNGLRFPLLTDCTNCVCTILNNKPLVISHGFEEVTDNLCSHLRLQFTLETEKQCTAVIEAYKQALREDRSDLLEGIEGVSGHYFREVL